MPNLWDDFDGDAFERAARELDEAARHQADRVRRAAQMDMARGAARPGEVHHIPEGWVAAFDEAVVPPLAVEEARPQKKEGEPVPYRGGYLQLRMIGGAVYVVALDEEKNQYFAGYVLKICDDGVIERMVDVEVPFIDNDEDNFIRLMKLRR